MDRREFLTLGAAATLTLAADPTWAQTAKTEVHWLGQAATRITTLTGKVIVIDPFITGNPKTPQDQKDLDKLGKVDVILVAHGHGDHTGDVRELARRTGAKVFGPAGLVATMIDLGWVTPEAREWVARFLSITPMEVHEVVTFYPMLFDKPVGRHVIHVCRTLSCDACGARELWEHLEEKLGVTRGGTTTDGRFTLLAAECLASCGTAPALLLDGERHENLDAAGVDRLLEAAR